MNTDSTPPDNTGRSPEAQQKLLRDMATFNQFIQSVLQEMANGREAAIIVTVVNPCDRLQRAQRPQGSPDRAMMLFSTLPCPDLDAGDY